MSSISSLTRANDPYEQLIAQIINIERQPQRDLQTQRKQQEQFKAVLSDFDSKLSALNKALDHLKDPVAKPFSARAAQVNGDAFTVSAGNRAALGSHRLEVQRLASADTRFSKQLTKSGTDLRAFFDTNGAQSFTLTVASPTKDDPERRVDVGVTVDPAGTTDSDILNEIASAINTALADAVSEGELEKNAQARASLVSETSSSTRLVLRSAQTGYAHRLSFSDSDHGLLSLLELNADTVATGTGGGQAKAVGHSEEASELNSKFVLDGLTLYRSSNQVADAISGVTLTLAKVSEASSEFTIEPDEKGILSGVKDFIEKYNGVLDYLKAKSHVDGGAGTRGVLAGDSTLSNLRFTFRSALSRPVSSQEAGMPKMLTEVGIRIRDDGTLELNDEAALVAAIEKNPDAVRTLFDGEDGVATRLSEEVGRFVGTKGMLKSRQDVAADRLKRLDSRIKSWDERMTKREDLLRAQFAQLQEVAHVAQGQMQYLNSLFSYYY